MRAFLKIKNSKFLQGFLLGFSIFLLFLFLKYQINIVKADFWSDLKNFLNPQTQTIKEQKENNLENK